MDHDDGDIGIRVGKDKINVEKKGKDNIDRKEATLEMAINMEV